MRKVCWFDFGLHRFILSHLLWRAVLHRGGMAWLSQEILKRLPTAADPFAATLQDHLHQWNVGIPFELRADNFIQSIDWMHGNMDHCFVIQKVIDA